MGDAYEAEGTSKRDLVFSFSPDSSIVGTNETVGNSVTFAVRPSYNNGNTTSVHADSVEAYIPENTNQYNITNGQCTIPEEEKIFNRYRFRINDLPDGYEYRLVASDGTTVLNNTASPVTVSASSNGYYYSRYALPLSANSYYANMSPSDSEQLTLLSNLLNTVNTAQEPHLLNTNHFMKEDNVWTARVQVRIGYSYHPRGSTAAGDSGDYGYDLRDFAEHIMSTKNQSNTFTLRNDITNSNNLSAMDWMNAIKPASSAWIDMLPAQYTTHFYAVSGELTGAASAYSYIVVDADGNEIEGAYASTVDTTPDITEVSSKKYRVVVTAENREGTNGSPLVFKLKRASYGSNNYSPVNNISNMYNAETNPTKTYTPSNGVYTIPVADVMTNNVIDLRNSTGDNYSYTINEGEANATTVDPTKYEWLAGIYKAVYNKDGGDYDRYYAVQEVPCTTAQEGGRLSDLNFQNTRIGIVNYHVHFDWNVGARLSEMKKVTLQIEADYHDGSGTHVVKYNDREIIDVNLIDGVNDYYITGLPKYTPTGQIITYTISEVKINDTPFIRKKCTLDNDTISAEVEEKDYIVNDKSNSDDLIPIVITNTFTGTRDCTVNKIWLDDTNTLNTRTDLYIRLYRHSTDPADANRTDTQIGKDYLWRKHATDSDNHWSYTYSTLPKYDDKGYRYEYYVKEISDNLKRNDYETYYENATHMKAVCGSTEYTSNDSVFTIHQADIHNGSTSLVISNVDFEDHFYDGSGSKTYDFRAVDADGNELSNVTFSTSTPDENGKVDLTISISDVPDNEDFSFRLQRKVNGAEAEYEYNTTYLTAISNAHPPISYHSNGGVFGIPKSAREGVTNFHLTLSGLEAKNSGNTPYEYRVVRRNGTPYSSSIYTTSSPDSDGRVTVTVTPNTNYYFSFRVQRKLTGADDSTYADVNSQWELIDDMWRDMPDFYQFEGSTNHLDHDYYPAIASQTTEENGRAYDNATITNKLVGEVVIDVNKLWQSIDPKFEAQNYPIADVFLYANIKSHAEHGDYAADKTKYARDKDFDNNGYAIVEGTQTTSTGTGEDNGQDTGEGNGQDTGEGNENAGSSQALGELMNILQISYTAGTQPGTETYHFSGKRTIVRNEQNEIQYQGNTDYVKFNDNINGFTGEGTAILDKYDENGALIKYSIKERAINGYTYRISNDTIINEYNGGARVAVKVTKHWQNMEAVTKFPTVKFTLYQCYVGKNAVTGAYELKTYNTFTETIRATNTDSVSYVFGEHDKDILYKYSPTGEEFFYYVTEDLIDANGQGKVSFRKKYTVDQISKNISVPEVMTYTYDASITSDDKMVLTDDVKLAGLGFTCTITEAEDADFSNPDIPIYKTVDVTNDYSPQEENFRNTITVDKNWERYDKNTQNPLNTKEFKDINNYGFTLKRKTKFIHEQTLFHINTGTINSDGGTPTVDNLLTSSDFTIQAEAFHGIGADGNPTAIDSDIVYYQAVLTATYTNYRKISVKIKVDKATKQVTIEGLAIYGKDGMLYTYMIEEDESQNNAFEPAQKKKSYLIELIHDRSIAFTQTQTNSQPLHFKLQRRIKAAEGEQEQPYTDVTEDVLVSEDITAADKAQTHTFTPVNGQYSIPEAFTQPDGTDSKKFTVVISGLASGYEYQSTEGRYLASSKNNQINMLVTQTVSADSTAPFTFSVQRRAGDTGDFTDVTENLPAAVYASEYVHTFSHTNGVFTVPADFAENGTYSVQLNNLPQKCAKGEYEYQIVNTDSNTPIFAQAPVNGQKVVGGMVNMGLDNNLKIFTFRLNKIFGAEYKDKEGNTQYEDIPVEDYPLYFRESDFISRLRYTVQRTTTPDNITSWENYINLKVQQSASDISITAHTDGNNLYSDITDKFSRYEDDGKQGPYFYDFHNLPRTNRSGAPYYYRVIEHEDSVGEYVKIYYPNPDDSQGNNYRYLPAGHASMALSTDDLSFKLQYSTDNGAHYTNLNGGSSIVVTSDGGVSGTYSAGTITVLKTAMSNNQYQYTLTITGLPNENRIYRVTDVTGGTDAQIIPVEEDNTRLKVTVDGHSKYFEGNRPQSCPAVWGSEAYVRNIFLGKEVTLKKLWDDGNNADGLRPEKLDLTLHETILSTDDKPKVIKLLQNDEKWERTVLLPRYYYNGDLPLHNILFTVSEDLEHSYQYYQVKTSATLKQLGYTQSDQGYILVTGQHGETTDTTHDFQTNLNGTANDNFVGLYIKNHKEYVNSKLTFEKQWNDGNSNSRPDYIYIRTLRRTKGSLLPDKDGFFKLASANPEIDFSQTALFQNLPQYYENSGNKYPFVYFLEPQSAVTDPEADSSGTLEVNLSGADNTAKFQLKRRIASYAYQTFTPNTQKEYEIPISAAMNGTYSLRFRNVPTAHDGINYIYRIVDASSNEMNTLQHIPTGEETIAIQKINSIFHMS